MRTFRVGVEWRQQQVIFVPQFYLEGQKQDSYGLELTPEVTGFIGWLPYFNKRWPHALDKILFKQFVQAQGLRTPEFWLSSESGTVTDVLIKPAKGSFGRGLRGPFRVAGSDASARTQLAEHEFYERFFPGRILKVWYWNEQPVCVEIRPALKVKGDGRQSVWNLVQQTFPISERAWSRFLKRQDSLSDLLAFQGFTWSSVLAAETEVQVDFLYGSSLYAELNDNQNCLQALTGSLLDQQIRAGGAVFCGVIPQEMRAQTLYTVDGMLDDHDNIAWLEMNCNPVLPPDAYPIILNSVFGQD
ncbi:MAG: hypothetical protein ING36_11290 [Burkholderiales bacterium]|nr:hypothetical protein [Burkholderiales bacterium]